MNRYLLGLGSNLNEPRTQLSHALREIRSFAQVIQISPVFENPPLLPANSPADWYKPFLNAVIEIESPLAPEELLFHTQQVELKLGRSADHPRWSPRPIDIDLLTTLPSTNYQSAKLTLPHPCWTQRSFVLNPMTHLRAERCSLQNQSLLSLARQHAGRQPALMAILNATPDSFSNLKTSEENWVKEFRQLLNQHPAFIDIGAESTRPGATPVEPDEEFRRLEPLLCYWREHREEFPWTRLSLDSRHAETIRRALDYKVDILNDVTGLSQPAIREMASHFERVVVMHSLTVPADLQQTLHEKVDVANEMRQWIVQRLEQWREIDPQRVIFDPGFGFGKTPLQSLELMNHFARLSDLPVLLLAGHSRKSMMKLWTDVASMDRDLETLGASFHLWNAGADILRIHNLEMHQRAFQAFSHARGAL